MTSRGWDTGALLHPLRCSQRVPRGADGVPALSQDWELEKWKAQALWSAGAEPSPPASACAV